MIDVLMEKAMREISHYSEYDHVIINDDFDKALNELRSIIIAARDETKIQSELVDAMFPDRSI